MVQTCCQKRPEEVLQRTRAYHHEIIKRYPGGGLRQRGCTQSRSRILVSTTLDHRLRGGRRHKKTAGSRDHGNVLSWIG